MSRVISVELDMAAAEHSNAHIIQSLLVNIVIAVVKAIAAFFTGSGAMLAEAIHSVADCGNQILLLIGVTRARQPASARHPLGHGRLLYFWSFIVALMLFTGGGVFSIYEGIHKIQEPEAVERIWVGVGVLLVSLALEGSAAVSNIRELNSRRKAAPFFQFLRDTKDSDLVIVFAENSAAVIGLIVALAALVLATVTGNGRWDGIGSLVIGIVLMGVAIFLATEVKSLLVGEAADPEIHAAAVQAAKDTKHVERVLNVITLQQGPGEVVLVIKLAFTPTLTISDVCTIINDFEARLRAARPEIKWIFVEPDTPRDASFYGAAI